MTETLAIVVSRADSASEHVGEHLLELGEWTERVDSTRSDGDGGGTVYRTPGAELREFDELHLETTDVGEAFGRVDDAANDHRDEDVPAESDTADRTPTLLVFASRHAGDTGPLLTAHHTGNFGPAEFGGTDGSLARACPGAQQRVLDSLREYAPADYDVGLECTHHGPSAVGVPSMFVELGSGEDQWRDPDGARAVAKAILDLQGVSPDRPTEPSGDDGRPADEGDGTDGSSDRRHGSSDRRHLVGFGGGHYVPRFERIVRETDWAVGHVAADWALDDLGDPASNRDVVRAAFERSAATRAIVDGDAAAGPGEDDSTTTLEAVVAELGYRVVGETWVRETVGVALPVVETLEAALRPVDAGLRFGRRAREADPAAVRSVADVTVVSLPDELLAAAQGVDADATRAAVGDATLAFETAENGTRARGRAAVHAPADRAALVDALADVLRERYETVEREGDVVVARERAFDPDRARTLGIPEGPKFGRLSSGQSVAVDGRTIDPETVHVDREDRFPVARTEVDEP